MIEVEIEDEAWTAALPDAVAVVERAATVALGAVEGDVVVLLTDDAAVHDLNLRFRDRDRPTNVLSFPFEAPPGLPAGAGLDALLGDLVICAALVSTEAREQGKAVCAHWAHLVVHGVLHLLDYDHLTDTDAQRMEGLETAILIGLGFPPPYLETAANP